MVRQSKLITWVFISKEGSTGPGGSGEEIFLGPRSTSNCNPTSSLSISSLLQIKEVVVYRDREESTYNYTNTSGHFLSTSDVVTRLTAHGCKDITGDLDPSYSSTYPLFSGGFGDVYRARLYSGTQVAIKTMRVQISPDKAQTPLKDAARELHTWSKCQHPNVLKLLGLVEFRNQIGMVSPWMDNGSLPSYLERNPHADRCQMSVGTCKGLEFLHRVNVVHGDLKGLNVLVSDDGTPVITDFGNAVLQERTLQLATTTTKYNTSPRWTAPELMMSLSTYSFAADVYALGMTILETITGVIPYAGKTDHGVYLAIAITKEHPLRSEENFPSDSDDGNKLWELLLRCWSFEPENRPSATHVWNIMKTIRQEGLRQSNLDK